MSVNLLLAENFTGAPSKTKVHYVAQAGLKHVHDSLASGFQIAYIYMTPCPLSFFFNV